MKTKNESKSKFKFTHRAIDSLKPRAQSYDVVDTEVRGLICRVFPSGNKSYRVRYRSPETGTWTRFTLGDSSSTTVEQARDAAIAKLGDIRKGVDPVVEARAKRFENSGVPTLRQFVDAEYAPLQVSIRKSRQGVINRIKSSFKDYLDYPLDKLTFRLIEQWRSQRLKSGAKGKRRKKGVTGATTNRDIQALKACLASAVEREILTKHPLAKLKLIKEDHGGNVRFLSTDEEARLLSALDKREEDIRKGRNNHREFCEKRGYPVDLWPDLRKVAFVDHVKPLVLLSLHTGARRGELLSLEWADVELDALHPRMTIKGEKAKSGASRHIPLNTIAADVLRKWRKQTGHTEGIMFPGKTGDRMDNCTKAWTGLLADAEIENFRWHDQRHHFASKLVMAGVDLNTVRELLGHGSIAMTLRYAHLAPQVKMAAVERLVESPKARAIVAFKKRQRRGNVDTPA